MGSGSSLGRRSGSSPLASRRSRTRNLYINDVRRSPFSEVSEQTLFSNSLSRRVLAAPSRARDRCSDSLSSASVLLWGTSPIGDLLLLSEAVANDEAKRRWSSQRRRSTVQAQVVVGACCRDSNVDFSVQMYKSFFELAMDQRRMQLQQQRRFC